MEKSLKVFRDKEAPTVEDVIVAFEREQFSPDFGTRCFAAFDDLVKACNAEWLDDLIRRRVREFYFAALKHNSNEVRFCAVCHWPARIGFTTDVETALRAALHEALQLEDDDQLGWHIIEIFFAKPHTPITEESGRVVLESIDAGKNLPVAFMALMNLPVEIGRTRMKAMFDWLHDADAGIDDTAIKDLIGLLRYLKGPSEGFQLALDLLEKLLLEHLEVNESDRTG